jgi:hypothetical protein
LGCHHKFRRIGGEKDEAFCIEIQHRFSFPFYDFNARPSRQTPYMDR